MFVKYIFSVLEEWTSLNYTIFYCIKQKLGVDNFISCLLIMQQLILLLVSLIIIAV